MEIDASQLLGFESGTWVGEWTTPAGPLRTGGRYSASWSKASGSWKIRSELFVTLFCEGAGCPLLSRGIAVLDPRTFYLDRIGVARLALEEALVASATR